MRTNKTVSFNQEDEDDVRRLEYAEQINPLSGKKQNFSKFVKRLIDDEMERNNGSNNGVSHSRSKRVNPDKDFYKMEVEKSQEIIEAQGTFL